MRGGGQVRLRIIEVCVRGSIRVTAVIYPCVSVYACAGVSGVLVRESETEDGRVAHCTDPTLVVVVSREDHGRRKGPDVLVPQNTLQDDRRHAAVAVHKVIRVLHRDRQSHQYATVHVMGQHRTLTRLRNQLSNTPPVTIVPFLTTEDRDPPQPYLLPRVRELVSIRVYDQDVEAG